MYIYAINHPKNPSISAIYLPDEEPFKILIESGTMTITGQSYSDVSLYSEKIKVSLVLFVGKGSQESAEEFSDELMLSLINSYQASVYEIANPLRDNVEIQYGRNT